MAKIYVSSTFNDLQEFREQVNTSLRSMGHEDIAMEYYTAGEQRPVDKCLADVAAADIYVGIFAFRYGYIPEGQDKSVTEQEYRKAIELGKPCIIFMLKDDAPWPSNRFEFPQIARVTAFRKELCDRHIIGMFADKNDLAKQVTAAIYNWALEHGHIPAMVPTVPQFDLEKYYSALRKRYGALALEGLTPPQKEEYLQIQLRSVFVEQSVRENPPPFELPKEIWQLLRRKKEIHEEDLPTGITLNDVHKAREMYYEEPSLPVLDVLTDPRHQFTIILGDPGSGKSTLARYVILSLVDPTGDKKIRRAFDGHLPLLIELRSYAGLCADGNCKTFLEFLEYLGITEGWALTQVALHNHLRNNGQVVVIFDGLDEIFDPDKREQITKQIVGFCNDYPKARIIVTSRVIGYRRKILTDAGFIHFTLQDLDEKQVESFVTRWYDLAMRDRPDEAKERRDRILRSFKESASIRQLAGNPMLLTIMAIIGKHQELPRERWKLYDHAASVLIQHWDVNKHLKDKSIEADFIGEDDKKELLRRLAFRMQSGDSGLAGNYIHREGLQAEFENYMVERYRKEPDRAKIIAEAMIQQFRERNFILSLYGANLYGFVHRAFLEYFCASAFVYKFEKAKEFDIEQLKVDVYGKHWEDQGWHEVLQLICGMIDEKWVEEIIAYLVNVVYRPWPKVFKSRQPWNIALAIKCLGEVRNLSSVATSSIYLLESICLLFEKFMDTGESELYRFLQKQVVPTVDVIGSTLPQRDIVIKWLERLRTRQNGFLTYTGELIGNYIGSLSTGIVPIRNIALSYLRESDIPWRVLALAILAKCWKDSPEAQQVLRKQALSSNKEIRRSAISILGEQYRNDPQALDLLRKSAVHDEDVNIRNTAILRLTRGYSNDPQTWSLVHDVCIKDQEHVVHDAATTILIEHVFDNPNDINLLASIARKANCHDLRKRVLLAFIQQYRDNPQALQLLRDRIINDNNLEVRQVALNSFIEHYHDNAQTLPFLHEWLVKSKNEDLRKAILSALAQYYHEDPETLSLLLDRAMNDADYNVRLAAVSAIIEYYRDNPQTLLFLREWAVKPEQADVHRAAVSALTKYYHKDPWTLLLLREWAVNSEQADVRRVAVSALVENYRVVPDTLLLLRECAIKDENSDVRKVAVSALVENYRDDPGTLPLLCECAIKDESPKPDDKMLSWQKFVRQIAIDAIARYWPKEPKTIPLLRDRAGNDQTEWLRKHAKELLAELGMTKEDTLDG